MSKWLWLIVFGAVIMMLQPGLFAQEDEVEEILDIVNGKVATVDLAVNKLSITDMDGESQEFDLDPNLTTIWDDVADEEKELSDLEVGKEVVVEFRVDENGKKIASWIDLVAAEEELMEPAEEEVAEEPVPVEEETEAAEEGE